MKWGIVQTETILKEQVLDFIWQSENDFVQTAMVPGSEVLQAYKKETYNV